MRRLHRWIAAALFLAPAPLAYVPGLPAHGYGHVLLALPILSWLRNRRLLRRYLLYGAALALQWLAFPKPDFGFLGFTLLLPYLVARELDDGAPWWRAAMLFGFLRAHAGFEWVGDVHYTAWIGVSLPAALAFAASVQAIVRHARFLPFAFRVGVAWTLFEWVHSWFVGGLPWLFLSHTQHRFLALAQCADVVGAYGVSFVVAFVQAGAFQAWRERRALALAAPAAVLAAVLLYGSLRLAQDPAAPAGKVVLLVQSSLPVSLKEERGDALEESYRTLSALTARGLEGDPPPSLVVWPETLHPAAHVETDPGDPYRFKAAVRSAAAWMHRPAIYGANTFTDRERIRRHRGHNSAVLVDAEGNVAGVYRKQRLVPMGELFLPRLVFPEAWCDAWISWLVEGPLHYPEQCDLEWGDRYVTLDAGEGLRCATLICFEGLYPHMARAALREGRPDLLLHLANHGWFPDAPAQAQAKSIWVFRAIETRTPFLSCANLGVTCAIAPTGEVLGSLDDGGTPGFLAVRVPPRWSPPLFLRFGPWSLPIALAGVSALLLLRHLRAARASRPHPA